MKIDHTVASVFRGVYSSQECDNLKSLMMNVGQKQQAQTYSSDDPKGSKKDVERKGYTYHTKTKLGVPLEIIPSHYTVKLDWCLQKFRIENDIRIDVIPSHYEFQMAEYSEEGDHFIMHRDSNPAINIWNAERKTSTCRKVSSTILLSNERDFEGAGFRVETADGNTVRVPLDKGDMIMFPSWLRHQVDPLISGERFALVTWMLGDFWT